MTFALRGAVMALMLASPIAIAPAFAQYARNDPSAPSQSGEAHRGDGREARQQRQSWRDDRSESRWDDAQHNGYYQNNVWRHGPPPAARAGRPGIALGYQPWARGERLGYYRTRYEVVDYRTLNRRHPRRGYHWVRDERGDALLVAIASGVIADIIINDAR